MIGVNLLKLSVYSQLPGHCLINLQIQNHEMEFPASNYEIFTATYNGADALLAKNNLD